MSATFWFTMTAVGLLLWWLVMAVGFLLLDYFRSWIKARMLPPLSPTEKMTLEARCRDEFNRSRQLPRHERVLWSWYQPPKERLKAEPWIARALIVIFLGPLVYLGVRLLPALDFRLSINLRVRIFEAAQESKRRPSGKWRRF